MSWPTISKLSDARTTGACPQLDWGGLWKWMREEVTRHFCHASMRHLFDACEAFIDRISADPQRLVSRLSPRLGLDPEFEKFLVSV